VILSKPETAEASPRPPAKRINCETFMGGGDRRPKRAGLRGEGYDWLGLGLGLSACAATTSSPWRSVGGTELGDAETDGCGGGSASGVSASGMSSSK
jgi:hypothetical protein